MTLVPLLFVSASRKEQKSQYDVVKLRICHDVRHICKDCSMITSQCSKEVVISDWICTVSVGRAHLI